MTVTDDATADDAQTKTNIDNAETKLAEIRDELRTLQENPIVDGYGAGDYIDEAISHLESASVDVKDARSELLDDTPGAPSEQIEVGDVLRLYEDTYNEQRWAVTGIEDGIISAVSLECEASAIEKGIEDEWIRSDFDEVFQHQSMRIEGDADDEVSDE